MKKNYLIIAAFTLMAVIACKANNVAVSNVSLTGQSTVAGANNSANYTNIKFDVTWDNSWRNSGNGTPNNWDAVWVFAKYRQAVSGATYQPAIFSTNVSHHSVGTPNGIPATITPSQDVPGAMGVFIYRTNPGTSGTVNWQNVNLRWMYRYGTDKVADSMQCQVLVFAIEMVYIPQGSFYLGDGNSAYTPSTLSYRVNGQGATIPKGNEGFLVTSESAAITTVSNASTSIIGLFDPAWNYTSTYTIPAAYPKGYNAFYIMKYEISQKQYLDFFNTLSTASTTQKNSRNLTNAANRNTFYWDAVAGHDAVLSNLGGSSGDRAQNFMCWGDGCAYADWAGLRPMSDFEYEKASRGYCQGIGPIFPTNNTNGGEFAWGNNIIKPISATLVNEGTVSETLAATDTANANYNNVNPTGPVRVGIFAAKNLTLPGNTKKRKATGASFYGVMEMSGNLWELVVSAFQPCFSNSTPASSTFTSSIHGDGLLNSNGRSDIQTWSRLGNSSEVNESGPSFGNFSCNCCSSLQSNYIATYGSNAARRGGSWLSTSLDQLRVSYRGTETMPPCNTYEQSYCSIGTVNGASADYVYTRQKDNGFRCVRTAP